MTKTDISAPKVRRSLQTSLAIGYAAIIAALLLLLNTYPLLTTQNLMFRAQQDLLQNQAVLVLNSLTTADELTPETAEQAVTGLDLEVRRVIITDRTGVVLLDTAQEPLTGQKADIPEITAALACKDAFCSDYADGVFTSRAATPIMVRNTVVGALCLYGADASQGVLLNEIQHNLRLISLVVCAAVLILFAAFSRMLTRRVSMLLGAIRRVREGEYTHRVTLAGQDELSQLGHEFNQLTGRLQATEEERRRFVSDASHELKTPLASIKLMTDSILQDESIDRDTTREFVGDISEAADRLIHISQELLELNRLDEGRRVAREPVDADQSAEQICRMLSPLAAEAEVTLELDPGGNCVARCGREDMAQVLRNLIENAIKYNVPGGRVMVSTKRDSEWVTIAVADTGVGIPQEDRDRIFQRFYRVDKARSRAAGGTGLGLSIVRDTVRLHGGQVAVAPREGGGTVFTVQLPAWRDET